MLAEGIMSAMDGQSFDADAIGIYPHAQSRRDMFLDLKRRLINFEFFQPYFDQVALPIELAKTCLTDIFKRSARQPGRTEFVKFIPLSALKSHKRLPNYELVQRDLVDYRDIDGFTLQGGLSWWGGEDVFRDSPCVFVSHRWQSADHPDPDGSQLVAIVERLDRVRGDPYLWIDFSCLPQGRREQPRSDVDIERLRLGLGRLPEILKSCDLMILYSPDYLTRAWCFSELFVWLCKLAEVGFTSNSKRKELVRSVQTRHLPSTRGSHSNAHHFARAVSANLAFRGYEGSEGELLTIFKAIEEYCHSMTRAADYHIAGMSGEFEGEYLALMINFLCRTWYILQRMSSSIEEDIEVCLRVVIDGLKYDYVA